MIPPKDSVIDGRYMLTTEELALISDKEFFRAKARISSKVRHLLDDVFRGLQEEVGQVTLLTPQGFNSEKSQFVKGEHLEDFPYQYVDFPKHFSGSEKFTFRSLFWWGHHFVFALIVEGEQIPQYKKNIFDRFHAIAGRSLSLCLSPSLWEWKEGEGFTLPITHDRKSNVAAILSERTSFKIARFVPYSEEVVRSGQIARVGRETFQSLLPIMTP